MSSGRAPMRAPDLPGYTFQRLLGSGGYSDVFLYEQQMPRRPVAIKVLLAEALDAAGRQQFTDEANAMAAVSTHPYIVTIFHAEVAGGHPFLVMEFFPRPNFSVRARTEQLSVAEVLRTGVQVASAVETAHRAGILHRDIKPANILTSEYGRPGLTDFGIAATAVDGKVSEAAGMSIPWSPPEVVVGSGFGDERADVYSLGATVYTLLAGRSPFEVVGGSNRTLDLMERVERQDAPPTGRGDVPSSLERLLRQTLSKSPDDRPSSAASFARALQDIEVEQGFGMTPLEVRDDHHVARARGGDDPGEDGTRLKSPVVIQSQTPVESRSRPVSGTTAPAARTSDPTRPADGTVHRGANGSGLISGVGVAGAPGAGIPSVAAGLPTSLPQQQPVFTPASEATSMRSSVVGGAAERSASSSGSGRRETEPRNVVRTVAVAVLAIALALVLAKVALMIATGGGGGTTTTTTTTRPDTDTPVPGTPAAPKQVTVGATPDGRTAVSWIPGDPPAMSKNDFYKVVGRNGEPSTEQRTAPGQTSVEIAGATASCFRVSAVRAGAESVQPTEGCA